MHGGVQCGTSHGVTSFPRIDGRQGMQWTGGGASPLTEIIRVVSAWKALGRAHAAL